MIAPAGGSCSTSKARPPRFAFVYQTLFAYARRELSGFLAVHWDEPAVTAARKQIARDAGAASYAELCARTPALTSAEALRREDVPSALAAWAARGLDVRIYSSGSAEAQRLFFAHTESGSLTHLLRGYYDTLVGSKREPASYGAIAADMQLSPQEVLFLSDLPEELDAARAAGLATGLVMRPGNAPATDPRHSVITDFGQIVISGVSR